MISIELNKRMQITEASTDIVEPFKRVVEVAMRRVREGVVDSFKRQRVVLEHDAGNRVYQVIDVHVEKRRLRRKVRSTEGFGMQYGLFIDCIQLDESGNPVSEPNSIQLPRDVSLTTQKNLFLQRGTNPEDINRLAEELAGARKVGQDRYDVAVRKLRERQEV